MIGFGLSINCILLIRKMLIIRHKRCVKGGLGGGQDGVNIVVSEQEKLQSQAESELDDLIKNIKLGGGGNNIFVTSTNTDRHTNVLKSTAMI